MIGPRQLSYTVMEPVIKGTDNHPLSIKDKICTSEEAGIHLNISTICRKLTICTMATPLCSLAHLLEDSALMNGQIMSIPKQSQPRSMRCQTVVFSWPTITVQSQKRKSLVRESKICYLLSWVNQVCSYLILSRNAWKQNSSKMIMFHVSMRPISGSFWPHQH